MGKIDREDMLELTRRMNLSRNCFGRIAGAYLDDGGFVDGTFNIHFLKLSQAERSQHLSRAKQILLAGTNTELVEYRFSPESDRPDSIRRLLSGLVDCELKNDALLDVFYEAAAEHYKSPGGYGILFLHGNYDIPRQGSDKVRQWESEEVYRFLLCLFCPLVGEYEPGDPDFGFLYPAYKDRGALPGCINIFHAKNPQNELRKFLLGEVSEKPCGACPAGADSRQRHPQERRLVPQERRLTPQQRLRYQREAARVFPQRCWYYARKMGVTYHRITIREQKTRWGSCSSKGNLNFNWKLLLAPAEVLDYVVVHELCHLKEMNHSPAFWNEVRTVMPDYELSKKWLKDNGWKLMEA